MSYEIIVPKPVQKQLDVLPDRVFKAVIKRLISLKENPRPHGCTKLKGYANEYRLRCGDYRIRYEIRDDEHLVLLLHCRHRQRAYKS